MGFDPAVAATQVAGVRQVKIEFVQPMRKGFV
jgi:hypothetical protein